MSENDKRSLLDVAGTKLRTSLAVLQLVSLLVLGSLAIIGFRGEVRLLREDLQGVKRDFETDIGELKSEVRLIRENDARLREIMVVVRENQRRLEALERRNDP